jgi:hypothetical protein
MKNLRLLLALTGVLFVTVCAHSQKKDAKHPKSQPVRVGAWYFGGWSFKPDAEGYTYHISPTLVRDYTFRKPVWGWREDGPGVMEQQIDYASKNGISFWGFCWYENSLDPQNREMMDQLNTGVELFLKAKNRQKLDFFLLSCFPVSPANWEAICSKTIRYFKEPNYYRVDDKPVISFFDVDNMLKGLDGPAGVKKALDRYRAFARSQGHGEVLIGARTFPRANDPKFQEKILACGFDFLTTYNNADDGRAAPGENPYANLLTGDQKSWREITEHSDVPFLPVLGTGYDMRPWANDHPTQPASDYWYTNPNPEEIGAHLREGIQWVKANPQKVLGNSIIIYAWNENGEGAWLTPDAETGEARLRVIKKVIEEENRKK